jgi:hypothetical protein
MKKIILLLTIIVSTLSGNAENRNLEELIKVNAELKTQRFSSDIVYNLNSKNLTSYTNWISAHLMLVEYTLKSRDVSHLTAIQRNNRAQLIEKLNAYWKAGIFPINDYLPYKSPVFIDRIGTHCAVGYLMQQSGSEELARKIDEYAVRNYAVKTLQFCDFDSMRMGTTDVANLVCILNNQSEYEEKIQVDFDVSAPMLQINSYMQNLKQRYFSSGMVRQFFLNLEAMLQINDSTLWSVRRTVIDWRRATDMEKRMAIDNIRREIHRHSLLLDIVELLPNM